MDLETAPPPSYKIVVLGDSSVGKTSLIHRFTTDNFNPHTANTIGAAFITKVHNASDDPRKEVKLEMWDTAGQERYRSLTPMYYRNAKVALVCFDLGNIEETLATAKYWIEQLKLNGSTEENAIRMLLVGNKSDLYQDNEANRDMIRDFCDFHGLQEPFHTSAKSGSGILELFNEVLNGIGDGFFEEYYEQKRAERENKTGTGVQFLNSRLNPSSSCC